LTDIEKRAGFGSAPTTRDTSSQKVCPSNGGGHTGSASCNINGKKVMTLHGPNIADEFKTVVEDYIERRFGVGVKG
jgi:hypothetical protein